MKVKMLTTMAGPEGVANAGTIADLAEDIAYDLVERGFAELAEWPEPLPVETATEDVPESPEAPSPVMETATATASARSKKR